MEELREKKNNDDVLLQGICYVVLSVDSRIRFAGIVNGNGKLLVGKYRQKIKKQKEEEEQDSYNIKSSLFYAALVTPGLNICKKHMRESKASSSVALVEFEKIKLAMTPLSSRTDRYLCIYLEPSAPYEETVRRVIGTV